MAHQFRYFLISCIMASSFFTASAETAPIQTNDKKTTLESIDQSMRDFGKRIKRYYKCVTSECSKQEMEELKQHIYRDAAIIVTGIAGITALGYGSYYLFKPKQKQKTEPTPMEQLAEQKAAGREQVRHQVDQLQRSYNKKIRFDYDGAKLTVSLDLPIDAIESAGLKSLFDDLKPFAKQTIKLRYFLEADQGQGMELIENPEKKDALLRLIDGKWETTDENITPILEKAAAYRKKTLAGREAQGVVIHN